MRSAVGSVTCDPHTLWLPRAPGPLGFRGSRRLPFPRGVGPGAQTTPPRLPSLLRAWPWWDRPGRSPSPILGPSRVWVPRLGGGMGAWDGLPVVRRFVGLSLCLSVGGGVPLHPILHPGPSPLRGCFPLPVFFPALAPPRAAWSGGGGGAPQEASVLFLYHHPSLPIPPMSLKKKFGWSCELGGCPGVRLPQSVRENLPRLCGTQVCRLGPRRWTNPSCLLPFLHPVSCTPQGQLLSPCPPCPSCAPEVLHSQAFMVQARWFPDGSTWTQTQHTLTHAPLARAWLLAPRL